ncbi:MAG: HEAT repeat domain-containing protein [Ignavibacterium sp.]|uniref:hypothetical protein n=1 Tax=Ignavibacterium sp. TaxID=2651167 RepID=UPI003296DBA4
MEKIPEYEERAKNELIKFVQLSDYDNVRYAALMPLYRKYGVEMLPLMLQVFTEDEDENNRQLVLDLLIKCCKTEELHSLLKERLLSDSDFYVRYKIMGKLLSVYGRPEDYKFVLDYLPNEPDPKVKEFTEDNLDLYEPSKPDSNLTTENLINEISNQIETIYGYNWLGDLQFKDELQNILQSAKTNLQSGDSLACRVQIKTFQDLVDNVYKDSLNTDPRFVTIEGWKFLYWNAQYILERLPEPPVIVNSDIEEINPAMSLVNMGAFTMEVKGTGFTANSVVYFNGNTRTTTYVADTLLTAEIQSTDVSIAGNYPVWVSSGTTNSDTVIYKVVNTLPQPVRPVLECVRNNGDGTYTAYFGYKNDNTVSVYIPVGSKNKFTPTPQDRGQTRVFLPGRKYKVFTVNFNGSNLVWTLNGRTSTASSNTAPCN